MLASRCSAHLAAAQRQPVAVAFVSGVRHLKCLTCIPELAISWQRSSAKQHIRCLSNGELLHCGLLCDQTACFCQLRFSLLHAASTTSSTGTSDTAATLKLQSGQIHVIFGPMFAGKSSELLRRISEFEVCSPVACCDPYKCCAAKPDKLE